MLRTIVRLSPSFTIPIFNSGPNKYDTNIIGPDTGSKQTGWERVKQMYSKSEYDEVSVELTNVIHSTMCGGFVGACLGGFFSSKVAYINFIENNQATIYKSTADAKKKLQDYVTIAFAKGAYKWGWRLCFFTGTFSLLATTISVYRGDTSIVEYITAGAITGALYKVDLGLAATVVGGCLGAALSTVAGLVILGILKITGVSMDEIRKALYKLKEARKDQYDQALEKSGTIKNDHLTEHHKEVVEKLGERNIENIE